MEIWNKIQVGFILHFENTFRLGNESSKCYQRRWKVFPHIMKIIEYHSPNRLQVALAKTPIYKRIIQRLGVQWIGFRFNPTLLLGLQEHQCQYEESKEWQSIEENVGSHLADKTTASLAWDFKKVIREMNEKKQRKKEE